jgi:hypothetical protein
MIPFSQRFDADAIIELSALAEADPYTLKLRQLQSMANWMRLLQGGGNVSLEIEEWINKSSGRARLQLAGWDAHGNEVGVHRVALSDISVGRLLSRATSTVPLGGSIKR